MLIKKEKMTGLFYVAVTMLANSNSEIRELQTCTLGRSGDVYEAYEAKKNSCRSLTWTAVVWLFNEAR